MQIDKSPNSYKAAEKAEAMNAKKKANVDRGQ